MRMHVNGLDPLATHDDLAAALRLARTATHPSTGVSPDHTADKGEGQSAWFR
jgi:hypothetical protein